MLITLMILELKTSQLISITLLIEKFNELRPRHYTNSVDLVFGPVVDVDPTWWFKLCTYWR